MKGKITILRDSAGVVTIQITDKLSGKRIVNVRMTPEDFAESVFGLAYVPCEYEALNLDKIGLKRETKQAMIICPIDGLSREELEEWLKECGDTGTWEPVPYLGSKNSVKRNPDGPGYVLRFTLERYVDPHNHS